MSELPSDGDVLRWYECERKVPLTAAQVNDRLAQGTPRQPYPCPYGSHWHMGRPRLNPVDNHAVRHGRVKNARKAWLKENQGTEQG